MIFVTKPKIILKLSDRENRVNLTSDELWQLGLIAQQRPNADAMVHVEFRQIWIDGNRFNIDSVTDETLLAIERMTARYEHRFHTILSSDIRTFLDHFSELIRDEAKVYRLPYPLWRALRTTSFRVNLWEDQGGLNEWSFEVKEEGVFRIGANPYVKEALRALAEKKINDKLDEKTKNQNEEKENESMNIKPNMNFDFGACTGNDIAMSPYGLAIKWNDTWLTYNPATNQTIDVNGIVFHMKGMIYKIPVAISAIQVGDLIVHQSKPMYVTSIENQKIEAVDIRASEAKTIIPVTNMFGFNFVTKVTSLMGTSMMGTPSADQPFGNIMPMLFMSQMFNDSNDSDDSLFGDDMMKLMMISTMCGGGANPFGAMFNFGNNGQG